jgi:hypothetical protein
LDAVDDLDRQQPGARERFLKCSSDYCF